MSHHLLTSRRLTLAAVAAAALEDQAEQLRQAVVIARLDNLGKGASGAAVQNLKLMLGL